MDINLIVVGKIKEDYLNLALAEYEKRLKTMVNLHIYCVKEKTSDDMDKNLSEEGKMILDILKSSDYVVTLEICGKQLSSEEFAGFIEKHYIYNNKVLTFVIGSSDGLDKSVRLISDYKLSFSKMTFPHQLMRVIFLEQLYRALSIINHMKYHK